MKNNNIKIKDMPISERPYERFFDVGAHNLSDSELLAIVLRAGTKTENITDITQRILALNKEKGISILSTISIDELTQIKGIGKVKAVQLKVIVEIAKRIFTASAITSIKFDNPETIFKYYQVEYLGIEKECFRMLLLNSKMEIISDEIIEYGTDNRVITTPKDIFKRAILKSAKCVILVHNHPSGIAFPSNQDIEFTTNIISCGRMLGIEVADHIIITNNDYFSMRENVEEIFI